MFYLQALQKQGLDTKEKITKKDLEDVFSKVRYIFFRMYKRTRTANAHAHACARTHTHARVGACVSNVSK